jgi:zinc protease
MVLDSRAALIAMVAVGLVAPLGSADGKPKKSAAASSAPSFGPERVAVERHTLPNGLVVLMHEDHSVPAVAFYQWYRVGSRNEAPGITGISHFFEHMMFNGSKNVPPKEYDRIIESNGGYSNAFTDRDMTAYYEEIASDRLDVLLRVDSDRMANLSLLPELLKSEVDVVKEERRLRTDNDIFGMLDEQLYATAFNASPYRWPVLGWMGDLQRMKREELVDYFRTYYAPNNCILVLVGDFDSKEALRQITDTFGAIPRQTPPAEPVDSEPEQRGERRVQVHYPAQNVTFMIGYKAPSVKSADVAALDLVSTVLSDGESSRLHRALVYDRQIALNAGAFFRTRLMPALFETYAEMRPGKTAAEGIAAMDEVIATFVAEGPTARELQRAKNQAEADFIRALKTNNGLAQQLGFYEHVFGDYKEMFAMIDRYRAVTADDCKRVAKAYLNARRRTVAELVPESEDAAKEQP